MQDVFTVATQLCLLLFGYLICNDMYHVQDAGMDVPPQD